MGNVKPGALDERDFGDDKTGVFDREDDLGTRPGSAAAVKALAPDPAKPTAPAQPIAAAANAPATEIAAKAGGKKK